MSRHLPQIGLASMSRLHIDTSGATPHPAMTCVACGGNLPARTTGRPAKYCSNRCKLRERRRDTKLNPPQDHKTAGQAGSTPAQTGRGLGTTARTTDMQVSGLQIDVPTDNPGADTGVTGGPGMPDGAGQATRERYTAAVRGKAMVSDTDTGARDAQFEMREALRAVSGLERLEKCGLAVLAGGVTPVIRNGRAGYAGVVTCGSVHVCPCCGTSIRRVRQDELDQVGQFWECQSCGLVMMTLTMRHYPRDPLAELAEMQRQAWKIGFGMNAGRTWRDAKKTYGVRGFVRAWEVTYGPNGWHVHYHVLLFLARPLASGQVASLQHLAFEIWSVALVKVGARMPVETGEDGKPVAVKIDAPDRGESGKMARYLMKGQDGKTKWGIAAELTRQDVKQGQSGHRTPFEIARDAIEGDAQSIELWREFAQTATGMRALYWSNGLRALLKDMGFKLDDRKDGEVAADEAAAGTPLALIPAETWYRHIARTPGRALALLRAAERLGIIGIRTLIEQWGLTWGLDVLEAQKLPKGAAPTADEVLTRMERANLAARMKVWRDEFDRQDRERRASRIVRQEPGAWATRAKAHAEDEESRRADAEDNFLMHVHRVARARRLEKSSV